MKIAFVVSSFPTTTETFIVNQIVDLIDRGHEIQIFAFQRNESAILHQKILQYNLIEMTLYFKERQVSILRRYFPFLQFILFNHKHVNFRKLLTNFNFRKYGFRTITLRFFYKYWWILTNGNFDIIHAHFGINGSYIANLKSRGFLNRTKLVTSFHGYDLNPSRLNEYRNGYKKLFLEGDLMTVNSPYMESLLKKITNKKNIRILPVGLDTNLFYRRKNSCNEPFRILFVGRLIELKAPHQVLEIYRALLGKGYNNIVLSIIGEGNLKNDLTQIIEKDQLRNVHLLGALTQEEIIKQMELAHVFLFPGIYDSSGRAETQGLVIQEAQSMELPVVISDVGGIKYGIIDGETGFVVKERDIEGFAAKLELLIKNEEKRIDMGKEGRKFVVQRYDSGVLGNILEKYYYQLLEQ